MNQKKNRRNKNKARRKANFINELCFPMKYRRKKIPAKRIPPCSKRDLRYYQQSNYYKQKIFLHTTILTVISFFAIPNFFINYSDKINSDSLPTATGDIRTVRYPFHCTPSSNVFMISRLCIWANSRGDILSAV